MTKAEQPGSPAKRARLEAAMDELEAARRDLETELRSTCPVRSGTVLRHRDTGALYRVEKVSVAALRQVSIYLRARRVYKTGRRSAMATTHFDYPLRSYLEALPDDPTKN